MSNTSTVINEDVEDFTEEEHRKKGFEYPP
jgi:hypothetical protein